MIMYRFPRKSCTEMDASRELLFNTLKVHANVFTFYENQGDSWFLESKKKKKKVKVIKMILLKSPSVSGYTKSRSSRRPKWPTEL